MTGLFVDSRKRLIYKACLNPSINGWDCGKAIAQMELTTDNFMQVIL
jgi:hypothetical protein